MIRNVTAIGLDHSLQQEDPTGDLRKLLHTVFLNSRADLVGEEAHLMPSTVAKQVASDVGIPWLNVDMDLAQRIQAGIDQELAGREWGPVFKAGNAAPVGMRGCYLPHADGIREEYWISQILKRDFNSAVMLCGGLHLSPLARKLRERGFRVDQMNVCEQEWYRNRFGTLQIFERNGERWYEHREPELDGS